MIYSITLHRERYPFRNCAHAWICSWYLLLVYTRYYSNPTAVLCSTGNITLFAHKEHNHGFPDFPVQQYSYTSKYQVYIFYHTSIFYFLVVVKHSTLFIYTRYIIPYVLEYYNFIHTWYIYTWYIRTAVYVVPWYHTTYDMIFTNYQVLYLFSVRQTYTWY